LQVELDELDSIVGRDAAAFSELLGDKGLPPIASSRNSPPDLGVPASDMHPSDLPAQLISLIGRERVHLRQARRPQALAAHGPRRRMARGWLGGAK
jgi:hypothetical protein